MIIKSTTREAVYTEFAKSDVWISDKFHGALYNRIFVGLFISEMNDMIKVQIYGFFTGPLKAVLLKGHLVKKIDHAGPIGKLP